MSDLYTTPPSSIAYIQDGGAGEALMQLPLDTEVTGYSGGGAAFESDQVNGDYQGTRVTANRGRFTLDVSARRSVISMISEYYANPRLFNLLVLETDQESQINAFSGFKKGSIFVDTGVTNESASASIMTGNSDSDPAVRDVLSLSAGVRIEIRKPSMQVITSATFPGVLDTLADSVYIPPLNRKNPRDKGVFIASGTLAADPTPNACFAINYNQAVGDWESLPNTGLPTNATVVGQEIFYTGGRLFAIYYSGANAFVAFADLANLGTSNFQWNNCFGLPVGVTQPVNPIAPDHNTIAIRIGTNIYASTDGGYSFTLAVSGLSSASYSKYAKAINKDNIFLADGATNSILHIRNLSTFRDITVPGALSMVAVGVPRRGFELYAVDDTGVLWRTPDASVSVPLFEQVIREKIPLSEIADMQFIGGRGSVLMNWETLPGTGKRLLIDYSGGYGRFSEVAVTPDYPVSYLGTVRLHPINPNHAVAIGPVFGGGIHIGIAKG